MHKGRLVREGTLAALRAETGCTGLVEMFLKLAHVGPILADVSGQRSAVSDQPNTTTA
jgi:hypothetical protein